MGSHLDSTEYTIDPGSPQGYATTAISSLSLETKCHQDSLCYLPQQPNLKTQRLSLRRRLHKRITAIRVQNLLVEKDTTGPSQQQHRRSHIRILSRPARRIGHAALNNTLIILPRLPRRHLGREHTRRNNINPNLRLNKRRRQHLGQMRRRGLGARIRKLPARAPLHRAADGRHVDDLRAVPGRRVVALCEQRQERHGHVEDAADVGLERLGPRLGRRLEEVR
jgi:hypothetical protein